MDASMWVAKTGLDAQQTRMNVISNNLANVNTTGFKRDRAVFEDLLYQNIRQAGGQTGATTQAPTGLMLGTGVRVVATEKLHAQGNMVNTGNPLDIAINGTGFYRMVDASSGQVSYTRNGQFQTDKNGYIISATGQNLTGYGVDNTGKVNTAVLTTVTSPAAPRRMFNPPTKVFSLTLSIFFIPH